MSKYVKNLLCDHVRARLAGVEDALLVNVIGLKSNQNMRLRNELLAKNIHVMVVKNSLARRAVADSPLAKMFEDVEGSAAVCWGGEDLVSLAKEITRIVDSKKYEKFEARGGVMDGAKLSAKDVVDVAKWPNRQEMLSILVGQILSPGATLAGQLLGPGAALASQVKQKGEGEGAGEEASAATAEGGEAPAA